MKLDFESALKQAGKILGNPDKLKSLLTNATKKAGSVEGKGNSNIGTLLRNVYITVRMLTAYIKGDYKKLPWRTLLSLTGGLIYFVSPIDIVPDFIPVAGFLDDLSVFLYILSHMENDVADFLAWEESQNFQDFTEVD
jgi:uncharacterized membrane protein YkvA (DUF1232 family)